MAEIIRSKLFIGILCIVLAGAVAFLLLPRYYRSQSATEDVIRVAQDIPAGTVIAAEMLTTSTVGSFGLSEDVVRDMDAVLGMVAAENLYSGEFLTEVRLQTEEEYAEAEAQKQKGLTSGMSLITIEFPSSSAGIAGVLRAGDTVDVYEYITRTNEDGEKESSATTCMSGIYVYDVLNKNMQSLNDLDEQKANLPEGDNTVFDFAPAYVVFRCSRPQILKMIDLERTDAMHLALSKAVK